MVGWSHSKFGKLEDQTLEFVEFEDEVGVIRMPEQTGEDKQENETPNLFTGPSYRNKPSRFRFDGHKMMHHLDRIAAWQNGEKFAPIQNAVIPPMMTA